MKTANIIRTTPAASPGFVSVYDALKTGEMSYGKKGFTFDKKSIALHAATDAPTPYGHVLDMDSLIRAASPHYQISSDPKDYVIVPVPIVIADTPNRNGVSFPSKELAEFSPDHGMPYYKTWAGKPAFLEHNNKDHTQAKGIILDVMMNPINNHPGFYKVVHLIGFDRTKDRVVYDRICSKEYNAYSMGAYPGLYRCSYCKSTWEPNENPSCSHINKNGINFYAIGNKLVYKDVLFVSGFEVSQVRSPAWRAAHSDKVMILDPKEREHFASKE